MSTPLVPLRLPANTLPSFYNGAGRIGRWRGVEVPPTDPEDWIASTSRRTGMGTRGLTVLDDERSLADAIENDPAGWLGDDLARRGNSSRMLLKLLDAGTRLPVHVHPDGEFARKHLGQLDGKAEAWLVLHAEPGASVHLGFRHDVAEDELLRAVSEQDIPSLLESMNRIPVAAGDVLYCPPGVPHAIGAGILVIEVQEPSDSSIMLEWDGFPISPEDRFLGLDACHALSATDRSGYSGARINELVGCSVEDLAVAPGGIVSLLPPAAAEYFAAEQIVPRVEVTLEPGFSVLFVIAGEGTLTPHSGLSDDVIRTGDVWLVPAGAGAITLTGTVSIIRCRPL